MSKLLTLTGTDGESVFSVVVNMANVAVMKPITVSKVLKTKIIFTGGAETNVVESISEIENKTKQGGQVLNLVK